MARSTNFPKNESRDNNNNRHQRNCPPSNRRSSLGPSKVRSPIHQIRSNCLSHRRCHRARPTRHRRRVRCRPIDRLHFRQKPIAPPRNRLHKPRAIRRIRQRIPNLVDRLIQPVVEIHVRIGRPNSFLQFFAGNDFSGMLDQHRQNPDRLLLQPYAQSTLAQFPSPNIQLKSPKSEPPVNLSVFGHGSRPPSVTASISPGCFSQIGTPGITDRKLPIYRDLHGEVHSMTRRVAVHCLALLCDP